MRKTKIVITLGPSTAELEMIKTLIIRGVNVFRLNFSHGDHATHAQSILRIREASKELGKEVAILQDISGPKVRIGKMTGGLKLFKGDTVILAKEKDENNPKVLDISYPLIVDMVNIGEEVFFADGTIRTVVVDKEEDKLHLKLLNDGELSSHKGVNFPQTKISISAITKKDEEDLAFGATHDIDIVALSFVQNADDILTARDPLFVMDEITNPSKLLHDFVKKLLDEKRIETSKRFVVTMGDGGVQKGATNIIRLLDKKAIEMVLKYDF